MKKNLLLTVFITFCALSTFAQHFRHGVGTGIYVEHDNEYRTQVGLTLTYSPMFFFVERANTALSIGIPITVGISNGAFGYNMQWKDGRMESTYNYMLDVPAILNFNWHTHQKHSFFVGGGPGFHMSPVTYFRYSSGDYWEGGTDNREAFTINANAGMRIGLGRKQRHNLELKIASAAGITGHKPQMFTATCAFNF